MKRTACSAYREPSSTDGRCFNGFPQTSAVCWGGYTPWATTPHCQMEEWCGRAFDASGGKPTNLPSRTTPTDAQSGEEGQVRS